MDLNQLMDLPCLVRTKPCDEVTSVAEIESNKYGIEKMPERIASSQKSMKPACLQ